MHEIGSKFLGKSLAKTGVVVFNLQGNSAYEVKLGNRTTIEKKVDLNPERPNVILYSLSHEFQPAFQQAVDVINQQRALAFTPQSQIASASIPEQIQQLAALREAGILTQEEFETKKAELLSRM